MSHYLENSLTRDSSSNIKNGMFYAKTLEPKQIDTILASDDYIATIAFDINPFKNTQINQTSQQTIKFPQKITAKTDSSTPHKHKRSPKQLRQIQELKQFSNTKKLPHRKATNLKKNKNSVQQIKTANESLTLDVNNKQETKNQAQPIKIQISIPQASKQLVNKLNGPSLREKFANLLPQIHQQRISSQQQQLLKIMGCLDQCIQFSSNLRQNKSIFFQQIKKRMRESLRVFLDIKHLQQFYYLDQSLYHYRWEWSYNKGGHDIVITLPKITSKDKRKQDLRLKILQFLDIKHQQFIFAKSLKHSSKRSKWHPQFQPSLYEIPRKPLPAHPEVKNAELRSFQIQKIESIKNNTLKQLIKTEKQKAQVPSLSSRSVMDMILKGKDSKGIQNDLLAAVKERQIMEQQRHLDKIKQEQKQKSQINAQKLMQILGAIEHLYRSKGVSNFFKTVLIQKVHERLNQKLQTDFIQRYVDYIISLKDIGYLKQKIINPRNPIICEVFRKKIDDLKAHINSLRKLKDNEDIII